MQSSRGQKVHLDACGRSFIATPVRYSSQAPRFALLDTFLFPPAPVRARALKQTKSFADSNDGALPIGLDEASLCSSMRLCILDDDVDAARSAIACFDCLSREHQVRSTRMIASSLLTSSKS
jgi:hypothetical protein